MAVQEADDQMPKNWRDLPLAAIFVSTINRLIGTANATGNDDRKE